MIDSKVGQGVGLAQEWADYAVGGLRLVNTVYTNTTGRPIMLNIAFPENAPVPCTLYVLAPGGAWKAVAGTAAGKAAGTGVAIIPPLHSYQSTYHQYWFELRM